MFRARECFERGGIWTNNVINFDNVFVSIIMLFESMTKEGWVSAMNSTSDIVDTNYINIHNNNKTTAQGYFVFWIIVGNFFIVNLFVGVIIDNFNMIKRENEGIKMLSKEQKTWVEIQKLFLKNIPIKFIKPPDDE